MSVFAFQMRRNIEDQIVRDQMAVSDTYAGLVDQYMGSVRWVTESAAKQAAVAAPLANEDKLQPKVRGIPLEFDLERRDALETFLKTSTVLRSILVLNSKADIYIQAP